MFIQLTDPTIPEVPNSPQEPMVGIDLGTTHCVISIYEESGPRVLSTPLGLPHRPTLIPSVVTYEEGKVYVGYEATKFPHSISSTKRFMGGNMPFNQDFHPINVSADILKALKHVTEEYLGGPLTQAVITVPAYFDEGARQETKQAAELAGLKVLRLLNEPTAAALAYGLNEGVEGVYGVYDLGGGTFDLSLIKFTKGVFQVLGTGGHTRLGGDDMDEVILKILQQRYPHASLSLEIARSLKEKLSDKEIAQQGDITFTREDLNDCLAPLIDKTFKICTQTLRDISLTAHELKGIILVGGATKIPYIRHRVKEFFQQEPLTNLNPDEVVAVGAAYQAKSLTQGSNTLLLDVTPLSLGIETMGGLVEKIIHRHSPVPVAKAQEFTTHVDGQTAMVIHVIQGEREFVKDCRSLGTFHLEGIPPMPAGIPRIRVTFRLDLDGLLTVSAQEKTTGVQQHITLNATYGLKEEEVLNILKENYFHGQQDVEDRLLTETRLEGAQFLSMLEAALKEDGDLLSTTALEDLTKAMTSLEKSLKDDSKNAIKTQISHLEELSKAFAEERMNRHLTRALAGKNVRPSQI